MAWLVFVTILNAFAAALNMSAGNRVLAAISAGCTVIMLLLIGAKMSLAL